MSSTFYTSSNASRRKELLVRYNRVAKQLFKYSFKKSYAVKTWTPITAYKLVEYLASLHLIFFKKFILQLLLTLWSLSMTFFFVCNSFVVRFAAT